MPRSPLLPLLSSLVLINIFLAYRALFRRRADRRMSHRGGGVGDRGGLGPFADLSKSCGYLSLLGMRSNDVGHVLARIGEIVHSQVDHPRYIQHLLDDRNWRGHLMALVAILISDEPASYASTLWRCFDRGSWVAPQLAVALYCSDPNFVEQAKRRILARCPIDDDDGFFRHGSRHVSAKNLASLLRALAYAPPEATWTATELGAPDVRELLRADE